MEKGSIVCFIGEAGPITRIHEHENRITEKGFAIAETLYTHPDHDEDGPPIARYLEDKLRGTLVPKKEITRIGFVSVADGAGGAGNQHVWTDIEGKKQETTMAYIASRKAQEAARNVVDANRGAALYGTLEEIRATLQTTLKDSFSAIKFEKIPRKLKGGAFHDFPTTFSAAVVQETRDRKRAMLFWAGDSPLFVFTPNHIFITVKGKGIALGEYALNARQLDFPSGTPLLVVAASDGIAPESCFEWAIDFIIKGVQNNRPEEIGKKLRDEFNRFGDDATIAMVSFMKPGEILKLNASAPTEIIL